MLELLASAALLLAAPQSSELRREALMDALRGGGYTVVLRHARTDRSFNEARDYVPRERAQQRNLSDDGIRDAALMGVVLRRYGVTFDEVVSSPMYRCVETAEMAYGPPSATTMDLRVIPSTPEQAAIVAKAPKPGTNRLIVTHHFVIETHVPGITPGEIGESEAVVVKTVDGKVQLVGRLTLDDWRALANPSAKSEPGSASDGLHAAPHQAQPLPLTKFPDTHAGHSAQLYIAAFNTGSRDSMKTFMEQSMAADAGRTLEDRLSTYDRLFEQFGPLTLTAIEKSESTEVIFGVQSRIGPMRITLLTLPEQPMRVKSVTFAHAQVQGPHR